MKRQNIKEVITKLIVLVVSSFICACSIKLLVQPNEFLSGGVSGLTILVSRYAARYYNKAALEATLYSTLYIIFNIPLFIFGFKKVGKQFIYYSVISVILFSILVAIIPSSWGITFQLDQIDKLTSAIFAGLLSGVSGVLVFIKGFSFGGTDIISMYLSRSKGKGIGDYSFIMNAFILIIGGIVFKDFASIIYTVIYFFINALVINNLYIGHKKVMVEIITNKSEEMVTKLMQESHHGCTIVDVVGAYSNTSKKMLRIVVSSNQIKRICEISKKIDEDSFATLINIKQVEGKFYIPPIK